MLLLLPVCYFWSLVVVVVVVLVLVVVDVSRGSKRRDEHVEASTGWNVGPLLPFPKIKFSLKTGQASEGK